MTCNIESLRKDLKQWERICYEHTDKVSNSQRDERKPERQAKESDEGVEQGGNFNQRD